jgi:mevalonate kinase
MDMIRATAPAKAILLGEHAVNRGQTALAVSVGLYASCALAPAESRYQLAGGGQSQAVTRQDILDLGIRIDAWRAAERDDAIQQLAATDFFAPAKYVLAALGQELPGALELRFASAIPASAGLGSGAATFVALAASLAALLGREGDARLVAGWARRGDIVAHGGIASGLDTQTALYGGAIRYSAEREGQPVECQPGLTLVIGNSGIFAATSAVNGRVRAWLAERPVRMHYFEEIGLLSRLAEAALGRGDWGELGQLMNLNQLILERIGVSCPELERLNEAALAAGALGAKLAGSGGGGIMIALVEPGRAGEIAAAIAAAGGSPIIAPIGVPGVQVTR